MLKDFTIANMLDMTQTIAGELFQGKTYPWEVLPEIGDFIVKLGKTLDPDEYDHLEGDIWIAKSARLHLPPALTDRPSSARIQKCATVHLFAAKLLLERAV